MESELLKRLISGIVSAVFTVWVVIEGDSTLVITLLLGLFMMFFEWYKINKGKHNDSLFYSGIAYITIPVLFWIFEAYRNTSYGGVRYNYYILWVLLIVWGCDIFAYFGGRLIGGPKFAPKISPKKTWSGVIVGSVCSFIISCCYNYKFLNWNQKLIYLGVFIIIASILGDLLESKVKRILNVKDSGNIIPGHGGICDRLDSFLLASYAFIIIKLLFL